MDVYVSVCVGEYMSVNRIAKGVVLCGRVGGCVCECE